MNVTISRQDDGSVRVRKRAQYVESEQGVPGKTLGRTIHIDSESLKYTHIPYTEPAKKVFWINEIVFDQGNIRECVGCAYAGALALPLPSDALAIYQRATEIDTIAGAYPQEDTGTSVLAGAKACRDMRLIRAWSNMYHLGDVLDALTTGPCVFGCDWYDGFDMPDNDGYVLPSGSIRGGHAFRLTGFDREKQVVYAVNSWGYSYAKKGVFSIPFNVLAMLLITCGECVLPLR